MIATAKTNFDRVCPTLNLEMRGRSLIKQVTSLSFTKESTVVHKKFFINKLCFTDYSIR